MNHSIIIRCKNNKKTVSVPIGSTLSEVFTQLAMKMEYGPIAAKVNNQIHGLGLHLYENADVEFLDMYHPSSARTYTRTLFFVLCKAVHDIFPNGSVVIDTPVSNGYYCNLRIGREVTAEDAARIEQRMQQIIDANLPIERHRATTEEAIKLFKHLGTFSKIELLKTLGTIYTTYFDLDGYVDYFYGALLETTGEIYLFGLQKYYDGLLLRIPDAAHPGELGALTRQDKMFEIFREHHHWQEILGISTVGQFNDAVKNGKATDIIHVSEALQEKKISKIAEQIAEQKGVKVVLIAGPSSSGKTTTCKRLAVQLLTCGVKPIQISLDDYFVNRKDTPLDQNGEYDYESIYALNIDLINKQFNALFNGETVQLPKYNFQKGESEPSGTYLKMNPDNILLVEGIHALNPELTSQIPESQKFRVYASALTTILLDTHNYIPTTDNRLLRRIIRDAKYRGSSAQDTIHRWQSVRAGEQKWIFPYQENADAMFNTAMIYELAVIKQQAIPLLEQVPENCDEYAEAFRLLKFLRYIKTIEEDKLPNNSLLREFLGGSSFSY